MTSNVSTPDPGITEPAALEQILAAAEEAAPALASSRPDQRAAWLVAVADALDAAADELVPLAEEETHLPATPRLTGELARTSFQLRLFSEVLDEGALLQATIDHVDPDWPMGPRPDIRRMYTAIGPVLVFAASNFPFAFSVAGGDPASALAAGCPVVVKAHPGHPRLSERVATLVTAALRDAGAPAGAFALIQGEEAGVRALEDSRIGAAAFTGSVRAGRLLFDIAASRSRPIPFYGELGSINPVVVTPGAVAARGQQIADEYVASFTMGAGQFCTKPGLLFAPEEGDLLGLLGKAVGDVAPQALLNPGIAEGYEKRSSQLRDAGARVVAQVDGSHAAPGPLLLSVTADEFLAEPENLGAECFGPASVVVTYRDVDQLRQLIDTVEPSLTATLHGEETETDVVRTLLPSLEQLAGRVLWNQWPTGVTVTWAQQHGGPYPATTAPTHTSVGTTAVDRFLRPVAWQGFPDALLPAALQEANPWHLPRRVDGHSPTASTAANEASARRSSGTDH